MRKVAARVVGLMCIAAGAVGCSEAPEVPAGAGHKSVVSGTVTVKGKPATGGTLVFKPNHAVANAATAAATVQFDGKFSVETFSGPCEVSFEGPGFKKDADPGGGVRSIILDEGESTTQIDF